MTTPKIASLVALAGVFGLILTVLIGPSQRTDYLLDTSLTCIVIAGIVMLAYVLVGLWRDISRTA